MSTKKTRITIALDNDDLQKLQYIMQVCRYKQYSKVIKVLIKHFMFWNSDTKED